MDLVIFLPLLIIMGAFMFFASRRQKKAMQVTIDLHNSLEVGDRIIDDIDNDTVGAVGEDDLDGTENGLEPRATGTEITDRPNTKTDS